MAERWCARCRANRTIEWEIDLSAGPNSESARCPACGTVWGTRARRRTAFDGRWEQVLQPREPAAGSRAAAP